MEKVLKPYVESAPEGIVPLLLLDSYHCHVMASVVNEIQDLGVEGEHIPGSCTYLCQLVDIGINKPYKKHMRQQWELWMISEGMVEGTIIVGSSSDSWKARTATPTIIVVHG